MTTDNTPLFPKSAIRAALARDAYDRDIVRIADPDIAGFDWLVASPGGVFAAGPDGVKKALHGRFFGIHRHSDTIYLFETCAPRHDPVPFGRIVRLKLVAGRLDSPAVLATGLDNECHQLAVIDGFLCVLDTANQAILRFTLDGRPVDVQRPFPPGLRGDTSGAYLHINAIAQVGDRIAIMLHNGAVSLDNPSELAWLDSDFKLCDRQPLPGYSCHDILQDERGILWHSASMSGEIIGSDGTRVKVTEHKMTRGLAITPEAWIVGVSTFGPRHLRDALPGGLVILDRNFNRRTELEFRSAPTDIIAL